MQQKLILAVVGLPGSGKTEVINHLTQKLNCPKVYFGQVVMDELENQGLEVNEANERKIREELRATYGMAAMAIKSLPKIKKILAANNVALVESLYSWEEYLTLKKEFGDGFKTLSVYASPATRYARLQKRPVRPLTEEEARSRDYSQIANLHQAGPIAMADFTVINEGTMERLREQIDGAINKLNL
ncbi:dephospho-CoA kinase [Candidatus Falkowbacteria bacterium CG10_big_fil_rev_8_21_14_0_10_43_11]|uniref:Dephospho-CoA kinase n=1 Tax=Candidatus Falkowbacteria bacterium CG10_big_fil_rev_8_21_14_0_10_43_11 TaxID=1974568 RepID=A0A2M6WN50_9BACT|nr:MAG: dephospho-CoA kinase [Candidatus Falkowbacteria bacterium CG10_big_fil_rev_8_21_14_0_10_43_11]